MTRSTFPYVTADMLITDSDNLLSWLGTLWPESAPFVRLVQKLLPLLSDFPPLKSALQHAADEINAITGAPVSS